MAFIRYMSEKNERYDNGVLLNLANQSYAND